MRIYHVLEKIENAVYNSPKIPWTNYALIRKDKILNLIEKTRNDLPEEMKRARWVSQENQRIIQESQVKAGEIVREAENRSKDLLRDAREESRRLLDKEAIVINAKNRADEILAASKAEAEAMLNAAREKSTELYKKAEMTATDVTYRANMEAKRTRKSAEDYVWKLFSTLDSEVTKVNEIMKRSMQQMQAAKAEEQAVKTTEIQNIEAALLDKKKDPGKK
ncbi:MAG: hypothetical protein LWY06_03190 [Firmicutes bacterium]|nr:hypothetical protein [Bacillota bacterium]